MKNVLMCGIFPWRVEADTLKNFPERNVWRRYIASFFAKSFVQRLGSQGKVKKLKNTKKNCEKFPFKCLFFDISSTLGVFVEGGL